MAAIRGRGFDFRVQRAYCHVFNAIAVFDEITGATYVATLFLVIPEHG
jgi:hypothetical protein